MNLNNFYPWIAQIVFFFGLIPQIRLNFKLKSTEGLSDFLLIGYFNAYSFYLFYIFCLDLPDAHKIMIPASFCVALILIFQRFYYSKDNNFKLKLFYCLNFLVLLSFIPLAIEKPNFVGHIAGWLMMFGWAVYQIPQVIKNYSEKSVQGLSFAWLSIIAVGDFTEFSVALFLGLPSQTYLSNFRGLFIYTIFCIQFWKYSKN